MASRIRLYHNDKERKTYGIIIWMKFKSLTALSYRNFRLFWFGQIISLTGTWMHSAAQGWLVFKLTNSPFYLGLVSSALSMPILLFTLAGGVLADRFFKRNIILAAQVILMLLVLILAVLVSTGSVTVWHVLAISFLIGTTNAFEIPARQSFFIEMVGKENLMNAIALNSAAFHGARMIGPTVAGIIIGGLGLAACFYINTLSFLAAIFGLLKMRFKPDEIKTFPRAGIRQEFKDGLKYIFSNPGVYTLILSSGIISFFGFPYVTFLPVYARDILKTGATGLGILMGFAGAGAFTGAVSLAVRGDVSNKGIILAASSITFSIALLIFSVSTTAWLSYTMLFFVGLGAINQIATANSLLQLMVPDELRGRVMSSFTMVFLGMSTIGTFFIGSLAHYTGTQHALQTGAGLCLFTSLLLILKKPEILKIGSRK
ncbi:MAG: MFS transporter [Nitrospiraceae bacterium]|nr:MAG: MFS transporter [Nitrospiraceae bacterium]